VNAVLTTAPIVIPSIHYLAILPVLILFGASIFLVFLSALVRTKITQAAATAVTAGASIAVLVVTFFQWRCLDASGASTTIAHAIVLDGFSVVATGVDRGESSDGELVAHDWAVRERVRGRRVPDPRARCLGRCDPHDPGERPDRHLPRTRDPVASVSTCWSPLIGTARPPRRRR
jgi:hypothetical protein